MLGDELRLGLTRGRSKECEPDLRIGAERRRSGRSQQMTARDVNGERTAPLLGEIDSLAGNCIDAIGARAAPRASSRFA